MKKSIFPKVAGLIVGSAVLLLLLIFGMGKYIPGTAYDATKDIPKIQNSDSAYLLDNQIPVSTQNFKTYYADYIMAPTMLYLGKNSDYYKNYKPSDRTALSSIFDSEEIISVSSEEIDEIRSQETAVTYPMINIIHSLDIIFAHSKTYIICKQADSLISCFLVDKDMEERFTEIYNALIEKSRKVTNTDDLLQFE